MRLLPWPTYLAGREKLLAELDTAWWPLGDNW